MLREELLIARSGSTSREALDERAAHHAVVDHRYAVDIDALDQLELADRVLAEDESALVRPDAARPRLAAG
jgi:hypothetical protein